MASDGPASPTGSTSEKKKLQRNTGRPPKSGPYVLVVPDDAAVSHEKQEEALISRLKRVVLHAVDDVFVDVFVDALADEGVRSTWPHFAVAELRTTHLLTRWLLVEETVDVTQDAAKDAQAANLGEFGTDERFARISY